MAAGTGSLVPRSRTSSIAQRHRFRAPLRPARGWPRVRRALDRGRRRRSAPRSRRRPPRHGGQRGDDARRGQRMPAVGQTAGEDPVVEGVRDGVGDDHAAHWDVAGVHAFGERDQVWTDVERIEGEPLAGPGESSHHLVEDQHDPVPVGDRPNPRQIARGRHQDACRTRDRLQQDRGDRRRALGLDHPFQMVQRARRLLLRGSCPELGAVDREEHLVEAVRRPCDDQSRGLGTGRVRVGGCDGRQPLRLLHDGGDDLRVLMSEVGEHQLAGEVQVVMPSWSHTVLPDPPTSGIAWGPLCADQE